MRRDFLWAMGELGAGKRVRREDWPSGRHIECDQSGAAIEVQTRKGVIREYRTTYVASRNDVIVEQWVSA